MQQLNSTDGQLLHTETPDTPEHIGTLTIYDQRTAENGVVRFKDILRRFETRLEKSPIFFNKIARVPFNIDQPFWVRDQRFDLEYHLRHIALPKPGDWRQLCIQVARLHAQQLDFSSPLWQVYVIEGLENVEGVPKGAFAIYMKVHHAAADGMAFLDMYKSLHDLEPTPVTGEYGTVIEQWDPPKEPNGIKLLGAASKHMMGLPFEMASAVASLGPGYVRSRRAKSDLDYKGFPRKPITRFDGQISRNRVFNGVEFAMDEVKEIRKSVEGCTINDVAVAIVAGGVRKYLTAKKALPETSLVAWIPVNIRGGGDVEGKQGNAFGTLTTEIYTTIKDPIERLRVIASTNAKAKRFRELAGDDALMRLTGVVPAPFQKYLGSLSSISAKMGASAVPANLTITNVPNSPVPIYLAGARAIKFRALGCLQHGHGLFHVVSSYCDTFPISFVACRQQLPDPQFYAQCLQDSFDEIRAAASSQLKSSQSPGRRTSTNQDDKTAKARRKRT